MEERVFQERDLVRHFKRELVDQTTLEYLYKIITFATHTETGEKLVVYQALYAPYKTVSYTHLTLPTTWPV